MKNKVLRDIKNILANPPEDFAASTGSSKSKFKIEASFDVEDSGIKNRKANMLKVKRPYTKNGGKAYIKQLKAEKTEREEQTSDAVVIAAREAWDIQQGELIDAVRLKLEALGFRFDSDQEFDEFVQARVYSSVIRDTTDNVVFLRGLHPFPDVALLHYSTAVEVDSQDGNITIKIG